MRTGVSRTPQLALAALIAIAMAPLACAAPNEDESAEGAESQATESALATVPASGGLGASCSVSGNGLTTCGPHANDNCCATAPIGGGVKLEKYQVTAGRIRAFLTATKNDVKAWYLDAKTNGKLSAKAVAQLDPYVKFLPTNLKGWPYGVYEQLGGTIYLPHMPSDFQGCYVGNVDNQGWGAHTYAIPASWEGDTRGLTNAQLARKAINCVAYPLAAAFCAWDGGRLQTKAEHDLAWGNATYPWGETAPGGFTMYKGAWTLVSAKTGKPCPTCPTDYADWSFSYEKPTKPLNRAVWDQAVNVLEPGHFAKGVGPMGHYDLAGNVMELTATFEGTTTTVDMNGHTVTQANVHWTKNGSWEGHGIGDDSFALPIMTKYAKTGVRCAHDD